ncbi:MAG: toprim domain-containing protein [Cyclobacteriaceae bacterium]
MNFESIKQNIDLREYAEFLGYKVDPKKSTRSSTVMTLDHADKVVISKRGGNWVYFSVYDDNDNGSILDFVKNRTDKNVFQAANELSSWINENPITQKNLKYRQCDSKPDPYRISRLFNFCKPAINHAYLQNRGISNSVISSPRFYGRIHQDQFKNAVFPHFTKGQICGLELKGDNADLFVRGSQKTLWRSNSLHDDHTLIIAETPIDAISYHMIFNLKNALYTATCGGLSKKQASILEQLISRLLWVKTIIFITDNDKGGDRIADQLLNVISQSGFSGKVTRHSPQKRGCDWNDVLNQHGI